MPRNTKQLRSLLGGISYFRKYIANMSTRLRPVNALLKQGVKFVYSQAAESIIRQLLQEVATAPVLVYPDWHAVADNSRPFCLYCDASQDGFGEALEQEQPDGSVRLILLIGRATLDSE